MATIMLQPVMCSEYERLPLPSADLPIPWAVPDDMLLLIADAIEDEPSCYNQTAWRSSVGCRTAFCIGGWAAHLAGLVVDEVWASGFCWLPGPEFTRLGHPLEPLTATCVGLLQNYLPELLGLPAEVTRCLTSALWQPCGSAPPALRHLHAISARREVTLADLLAVTDRHAPTYNEILSALPDALRVSRALARALYLVSA